MYPIKHGSWQTAVVSSPSLHHSLFQEPTVASLTLLLSALNIPNLFNPLWKTFQAPYPSCLSWLALLQACSHLALGAGMLPKLTALLSSRRTSLRCPQGCSPILKAVQHLLGWEMEHPGTTTARAEGGNHFRKV